MVSLPWLRGPPLPPGARARSFSLGMFTPLALARDSLSTSPPLSLPADRSARRSKPKPRNERGTTIRRREVKRSQGPPTRAKRRTRNRSGRRQEESACLARSSSSSSFLASSLTTRPYSSLALTSPSASHFESIDSSASPLPSSSQPSSLALLCLRASQGLASPECHHTRQSAADPLPRFPSLGPVLFPSLALPCLRGPLLVDVMR